MAKNFREGREMMEKTRLAVEKKALERKSKLAQKEEALREEEGEAVDESLDEKTGDEDIRTDIGGSESEDLDPFEQTSKSIEVGKIVVK